MRVKFVVEMQLSERDLLSEPQPREQPAARPAAPSTPKGGRPRSAQLGGSTLERAEQVARQQSQDEAARQAAALAQMDARMGVPVSHSQPNLGADPWAGYYAADPAQAAAAQAAAYYAAYYPQYYAGVGGYPAAQPQPQPQPQPGQDASPKAKPKAAKRGPRTGGFQR